MLILSNRYYPALWFIPFHSVKPWYTFHMFLVGFQPYIICDAVALPVQTQGEGESPEQFADRVQRLTAQVLLLLLFLLMHVCIQQAANLADTKYSATDKASLRKRMSVSNLAAMDTTRKSYGNLPVLAKAVYDKSE